METNNKLLEALKRLDELLYIGPDGEVHGALGKASEIERIVKDALAEPIRNCLRLIGANSHGRRCPMSRRKEARSEAV